MRSRRWDWAALSNVATPTPVYPLPNAYDINLRIDRTPRFPLVYIGPVRTKKPTAMVAFDSYGIWWTPQVVQYIDNPFDVSKYQITKRGPRQIKIEWRKNNQVLATTTYDIDV